MLTSWQTTVTVTIRTAGTGTLVRLEDGPFDIDQPGVLEAFEEARLVDPVYRETPVKIIGIPGDRFVDHGSVTDLRRLIRIDVEGLTSQVRESLVQLGAEAPAHSAG